MNSKRETSLQQLLLDVRNCRECEAHLPYDPRPVVAAHRDARILIVGQAPGQRVHDSGIVWNDPSGDRLREWMGVERSVFYDETRIALIPMGFCYPGTGKSGDLPPRPECAELWHDRLITKLSNVKLTLLAGVYAQKHYLAGRLKGTLTETVQAWQEYSPSTLPIPHPSPRNNLWIKRNPWFAEEVLPYMKQRVKQLLQ